MHLLKKKTIIDDIVLWIYVFIDSSTTMLEKSYKYNSRDSPLN